MNPDICLDSADAARRLGGLHNELCLLETRAAKIDEELIECEFPAHLGDPEALKQRKELLSQRAACDRRAADVRRAIPSGEAHVRRLQTAEREAVVEQWRTRAEELRGEQLQAARGVDEAVAQLERFWQAYLRAVDERGMAARKAGDRWSNSRHLTHLEQAIFNGAPGIAVHLRLSRAMRPHASKLEDLV